MEFSIFILFCGASSILVATCGFVKSGHECFPWSELCGVDHIEALGSPGHILTHSASEANCLRSRAEVRISIPCSLRISVTVVLSERWRLQCMQLGRMFAQTYRPPCEPGMILSTSMPASSTIASQCTQATLQPSP